LNNYITVQTIVLVLIIVLLMDSIRAIYNTLKKGEYDWHEVVDQLLDVLCGILVLVYVLLMLQEKIASAESTSGILDRLEGIPWSSSSVVLADKMSNFFTYVAQLMTLINKESFNNILCNIILIVNLLRVIQFTSLHPRLAMLTGTVVNALDDLWHTAILTCLLMLCFAGIGTWRFGDRLAQFGSFEVTLQTEFEMLFGSFPDNWYCVYVCVCT
jgi:hypothetical protein